MAYTAKKLGLRPLAVHFDNGWNSELAVDNIKRTLDVLGIDLFTHVVDWAEFKDVQLSFLKASVPNAEIPTDHGITATLFNTARKFGTRFILSGSNLATEGIMPLAWGHFNQDLRHLKAVHRRFGTVPLKTLPGISVPGYLRDVFVRKIRQIPFLNYIDYNKDDAKDAARARTGLARLRRQTLRVGLDTVLPGLLPADEVRLRQAQGALLVTHLFRRHDPRRGAARR